MSDTSSKPLTADDYAKARRHLDGSHDAAWLESFTRLILVNAEEQAREVECLRAALTHIIERYERTQAGSHGDEALLPLDHWNLPRAMQQEARDALGLPALLGLETE